jgi:DNA polymerase (family 10)
MKYGVLTARRGWLAADDIMNTRSLEQFTRFLRKK